MVIFHKIIIMYQLSSEIADVLEKDKVRNMPIFGFFGNYKLEKHHKHSDSLILLGSSDYTWAYISAENKEDLHQLLKELEYDTLYFANVEDWMLPILTRKKKIEWRLTTERYFIPEKKGITQSEINCEKIDPSMGDYIYNNSAYKDFTSVEYICDRLSKDISAGYNVSEQLVGWVLTHDDSSIGFLNIIQQFRGQGIGENLLRYIVTERLKQGRPAFVNIESQNVQTKKMLEKIGFEFDRKISWIKLT